MTGSIQISRRYSSLQTVLLFAVIFIETECVFNKERVIDETPMTIRVVTGSTALLPCSVDPRYTEQYADQYKVIWVSPLETAISLQDRRILNDIRISVERPFLKDWNLHIRNVSLTDAGVYKCQINTDPVGTKKVDLVVQEPPRIIDHSVPIDVEKPEGEMVELFCNATGTPAPDISWYRLHKKGNGIRERVGHTGESLVIHNISRVCGDYYECVADNGVPPAISQTFKVTVLYPPEVHLPNTRLGQHVGKDTILECEVSASPLGYAVWKHKGRNLVNSQTHELTLYNNNLDDSIILSLRILNVEPSDFGQYMCETTNPLGVTSQTMELYELVSKKTSTTTTTTTLPKHVWIRKGAKEILVDNQGRVTSHQSQANHDLVRGRQTNRNRPYNSQDGALRSENKGPGSSDGKSKYTGVVSKDTGNKRNGSPRLGFESFVTSHLATATLLTTIVTLILVVS